MMFLLFLKIIRGISFFKKPPSGGRPPNESIETRKSITFVGDKLTIFKKLIDFMLIEWQRRKIKVLNRRYKANKANPAFWEKKLAAKIQPMWDMDEYANIFRILVWLRPPHPPIITEIILDTNRISLMILEFKEIIKKNGAIFCQHAIRSPSRNVTPLNTSGNQKWQGAKPSLIIRAREIIEWGSKPSVKFISHDLVNQRLRIAPFRRRAALKA